MEEMSSEELVALIHALQTGRRSCSDPAAVQQLTRWEYTAKRRLQTRRAQEELRRKNLKLF